MNDWDTTARLLWALGIACCITTVMYGLQSLLTNFPPQPYFGPIGFTFLAAHGAYEWSRKRSRKETRR